MSGRDKTKRFVRLNHRRTNYKANKHFDIYIIYVGNIAHISSIICYLILKF